MLRAIDYLWAVVIALAFLLMTTVAHGQTTITLTSSTTWSALVASTTTNIASDNLELGGNSLTLDGGTISQTSFACQALSNTGNAGSIIVSASITKPILTCTSLIWSGTNYGLQNTGTNTWTVNCPSITAGTNETGPANQYVLYNSSSGGINVNLSGGTMTGGYRAALECGSHGNCTVIGGTGTVMGTLVSSASSEAVLTSGGTLNVSNLNISSNNSLNGIFSTGNGPVYVTNCNLTSTVFQAINGNMTIVAMRGNNYMKYPTLSGTITIPAAATLMGPWPVTNVAGTCTQIGPWPIRQKADGSINVGPYPVR